MTTWRRRPAILTLGQAIAARIEQPCRILWVDFTLKEVLPLK
jgi:hypothetical protein